MNTDEILKRIDSVINCLTESDECKALTIPIAEPQVPVSLLKKYIMHVDSCEGTDFISNLNDAHSDVRFTDDEIKTLEMLADEN